jgi:hypothetical protein
MDGFYQTVHNKFQFQTKPSEFFFSSCHVINPRDASKFQHIHPIFFQTKITTVFFLTCAFPLKTPKLYTSAHSSVKNRVMLLIYIQ